MLTVKVLSPDKTVMGGKLGTLPNFGGGLFDFRGSDSLDFREEIEVMGDGHRSNSKSSPGFLLVDFFVKPHGHELGKRDPFVTGNAF
jgi:hypothetical protein